MNNTPSDLEIAAAADLEAAARYRELANRNPSLRREYLKRAALAEAIAHGKMASAEVEHAA